MTKEKKLADLHEWLLELDAGDTKVYVLLYVSTPEGLSDPLKSHTDNIKVLQMLHVFLIAVSFIAGIVFSSVASTDNSNYDSNEEDDGDLVSHIVIYDEMLKTGLETIGYSKNQIEKASKEKNIKRFRSNFGATPSLPIIIYEDMQKSEDKSMRLTSSKIALKWFLRSVSFLSKYPQEEDIEKDMKLGSLSWA